MGKCSYTRYLWKCPEPTWRGSEKYCIFHDPSPKKDIYLFGQKLTEKLDRKDYKFIGYCFPENVNFHDWKFEVDANFNEATFQNANFNEATFQNAYFNEATFQNAYFNEATFQNVRFRKAIFQDM